MNKKLKNELNEMIKEFESNNKKEMELKNKIVEKKYEIMSLLCDEVIMECRR